MKFYDAKRVRAANIVRNHLAHNQTCEAPLFLKTFGDARAARPMGVIDLNSGARKVRVLKSGVRRISY